jgi:HEAT repeat protein
VCSSDLSRALVAFRDRAAPYVGALAGAGSADRRYYAVMVASEIPSGVLVDPLVQLVFDEDAGVRALVLEVLPKFRGFVEIQDQILFLRRTARVRGKDMSRRLHAMAALAALRDTGALRLLVDLLEDEEADVRRAAHGALVGITCEDLGESARRWVAWADKNEGRNRIEWLMDSLLHADEALRAQAGDELKSITQQYFGYHPGASRKEREVVQTKYRNWWEREGKSLFK